MTLAGQYSSVSIQAAFFYTLRLINDIAAQFDMAFMRLLNPASVDSASLMDSIQVGLVNSRQLATIKPLYEFNQIQSSLLSQSALIILSSISVVCLSENRP